MPDDPAQAIEEPIHGETDEEKRQRHEAWLAEEVIVVMIPVVYTTRGDLMEWRKAPQYALRGRHTQVAVKAVDLPDVTDVDLHFPDGILAFAEDVVLSGKRADAPAAAPDELSPGYPLAGAGDRSTEPAAETPAKAPAEPAEPPARPPAAPKPPRKTAAKKAAAPPDPPPAATTEPDRSENPPEPPKIENVADSSAID